MNAKFTIQQFAEMMSRSAGEQPEVCEEFLRALFSDIENKVILDNSVELPGLGRFHIDATQEGGLKDVEFTPDEKLAQSVNSAFSNFEPEILRAGVTEQLLSTITDEPTTTEVPTEEEPEIEPQEEADQEPLAPTPEISVPQSETFIVEEEELPTNHDQAPAEITDEPTEEPTPEIQESENNIESEESEEDERGTSNITMFIIGLIIGLALGAAATFFYMSSAYTPKLPLSPELQTEEILHE